MKKNFFLSAVISTIALLGAGCVANQPGTNVFDPMSTKVGDSIAGLRVSSVTGVSGIDRPMASDNVHATFSGQVTLTGTYSYFADEFAGGESACFTLTDASEKQKLPVLAGDPDQNNRFCFSNLDKVKTELGPSLGQGRATVTIDTYELFNAPAEVVNQARLVSVSSKTPTASN